MLKKIGKIAFLFLLMILLVGCGKSKKEKEEILGDYVGEYTVTFDENIEMLKKYKFYEKVKIKECKSKKEKHCLILAGNDTQLSVMEEKEGIDEYISIPMDFLIDEKKSDIEKDDDFVKARACLKWNEFGLLEQFMCPPVDTELYEKEELDPDYFIRLAKEEREK